MGKKLPAKKKVKKVVKPVKPTFFTKEEQFVLPDVVKPVKPTFFTNEEQFVLPNYFAKTANDKRTRSFIIARKPQKHGKNLAVNTLAAIERYFSLYPVGKKMRIRTVSQFGELPFTETTGITRTYKAPAISLKEGWTFFYLSVRIGEEGLTKSYTGIRESGVSKSWNDFSPNVFPSSFFLISNFVGEQVSYLEKKKLDAQLGHLIVANQEIYSNIIKTTEEKIQECISDFQEYFCNLLLSHTKKEKEQPSQTGIEEEHDDKEEEEKEEEENKKNNRELKIIKKCQSDDEFEDVENSSTRKKRVKVDLVALQSEIILIKERLVELEKNTLTKH